MIDVQMEYSGMRVSNSANTIEEALLKLEQMMANHGVPEVFWSDRHNASGRKREGGVLGGSGWSDYPVKVRLREDLLPSQKAQSEKARRSK